MRKNKLLLLLVLLMTAATGAWAQEQWDVVWDFTAWSTETVTALKADAAASKLEGWSDVEKQADAEAGADPTEAAKDNCFWFAGTVNEDGSLSANGVVIKELKGLKFNSDYAAKRSLAIAVNYQKALSDYAGPAYLWLGGGGSKQPFPCFTIPGVKAGSKITIEVESNKTSSARGIGLYKNSYAAENLIGEQFTPTAKEAKTWDITEDCDVVVWNTHNCHIYTIKVKAPAAAPADYTVSLKDGVKDADKWTISPNPAPEGSPVTIQYTGRLKVKGVTATSEAAAPVPVTYTALSGGEVLHVGDIIEIPDGQEWHINNSYIMSSRNPLTVVRANLTFDQWDELTVTEAADGAYYVIKDTGGWYYCTYEGYTLPVTGTSDGIYVTYNGILWDEYPDYTFSVHDPTAPAKPVDPKFTINASGDQVKFAPGNLQATYDGSAWTWAFATNQWDFIGNAAANTSINGNGTVSANGTVDLFGWVGEHSAFTGAAQYGITNSMAIIQYGNTADEALKSDWGNTIGDGWRTLTIDEWDYVLNTRTTTSGVNYAKATVNGKQGLILLPDDWSTTYYSLTSTNTASANYTSNDINSTDWTNSLESHGAVFLPAVGARGGTSVTITTQGFYWSATSSSTTQARRLNFTASGIDLSGGANRGKGHSVRLVKAAE